MQTACQRIPERTRSPWLALSGKKAKATIRLFGFPYAEGSSITYRSWQGLLPKSIDVAPV
jgi:hypothetical protein